MKSTNYSVLPVSTKLYATGTKHIKDFIVGGLKSEQDLIDFEFVREDKKDNFEYKIFIRHDDTKENVLMAGYGIIIDRTNDKENDYYQSEITLDIDSIYEQIEAKLIENGKIKDNVGG